MAVLVTGAGGFVGAALVEALLACGERVVGVDLAPGRAVPADAAYRFVRADLARPGALDAVVAAATEEAIDAVILGAAVTADAARERRDPGGVVAVNVTAVADALRAVAAHGVRRVVCLGSGAVYGEAAFTAAALSEDGTLPAPRSLYAITKLSGEAVALRLAEALGLDLTAVRLGTCFGPFERPTGARDTPSAPFQILRLAEAGEPVRLPRPGRRDWLYIRDAVAGILALLDTPGLRHRTYDVAAGFEWSLAEFCARLARERPGLIWSVSDPCAANLDLYDPFDRAPMRIDRLIADTRYRPRYDLPTAMDDRLCGTAQTRGQGAA